MKKLGVIRFPGTNCDHDVYRWLSDQGHRPEWIWYTNQFSVTEFEGLVLPGGFSFGDYLRSGALAARSPVMASVREMAQKGKPILGICNGFQILCESGLLPGALLPNEKGLFIDDWCDLISGDGKKSIRLPVAHGDGRFHISQEDLSKLQDQNQIWWRYVLNPNGSKDKIAGVTNGTGNVRGLMPHPERAYQDWMGGRDGWMFWI